MKTIEELARDFVRENKLDLADQLTLSLFLLKAKAHAAQQAPHPVLRLVKEEEGK